MTQNDKSLRTIQTETLDVLRELDRVCRLLHIPYYITAGTLLGAVRHKGFIPWDDDIDVVMPRKDYDRFYREGPAVLKEDYYFQDHRTEPAYPLGFAKLRKHGFQITEKILQGAQFETGVFVDIFPLDLCPNRGFWAKLFFYGNTVLNYALIWRCSPSFQPDMPRASMRVLWRLIRHLPNRVLFWFRECWRKMAGWFSDGSRLCTVSGRHGYPRESYPAEWFSQSTAMEFEGDSFSAPAGWESLLRNMYGDFMTPVKEKDSHISI